MIVTLPREEKRYALDPDVPPRSRKRSAARSVTSSNPGCLLQLKKGLADQLPKVGIMHLTELPARSMAANG